MITWKLIITMITWYSIIGSPMSGYYLIKYLITLDRDGLPNLLQLIIIAVVLNMLWLPLAIFRFINKRIRKKT